MTTSSPISHAMEDYLKAIYELSRSSGNVSTSQLAEWMKCTPASVTNMLQKLSSLKLVAYRPYKGVTLTPAGEKIALEVLRHHRLIELYLADILGYSWDRVHEEAEELEHVISEEFEDKIDEALGFPIRDPHGAPIPTKEGKISTPSLLELWEIDEGECVEIREVADKNPEVLRYLATLGIYPEVEVQVVRKEPFSGPMFVLVGQSEHGLSEELARQIYVQHAEC